MEANAVGENGHSGAREEADEWGEEAKQRGLIRPDALLPNVDAHCWQQGAQSYELIGPPHAWNHLFEGK